MELHRSMVDLEEGDRGQSAMGLCAFCYTMKMFCSVVVLHRSMVD